MKKIFIALAVGLIILCATPASAAGKQNNLPTRFTYAKEWVRVNILTWKADSKVKVLDNLATTRVENIMIANQNNSNFSVYGDKLLQIKEKQNNIIQTKNISDDTVNKIAAQELERQKTLSMIRQNAQSDDIRNKIVSIQEQVVNNTKSSIEKVSNKDTAEKFSEKIISTWRDPKNEIKDEKETRVYAAGTSENGTIDEGIIIDGGEAKIDKDNAGNLKIEYAPGTGPSSTTTESNKKVWKIQMSDGSVVESYTSGNVVVGQSNGTASNIVVNTVNGGTGTSANVVVGSGGVSGVTVVGGKSVVNTVETGNAAGTENTVNNSTNSVNQSGTNSVTNTQTVSQ